VEDAKEMLLSGPLPQDIDNTPSRPDNRASIAKGANMPIFKSGRGVAQKWCDLEFFDVIRLQPGQTHTFERVGKKEKLIVGGGYCEIVIDGKAQPVKERT
jgi:hypothetical protein